MNDTARDTPNAQIAAGWGSDAIADLLRALEIPYIALTPGASFRGLHDSLVNYLGNARPELLLCVHEESAVALAHGYARVAGRPLAVALHANVGLMHATMAIFNAWCDRIPVLLLGAVGSGRRGQAPAVGRLDPHVARPGRARPRLHEMGRPAGLGRRSARGDPARVAHRDDAAAGTRVRLPRRRAAGGGARRAGAAARARPHGGGDDRRGAGGGRARSGALCSRPRGARCS